MNFKVKAYSCELHNAKQSIRAYTASHLNEVGKYLEEKMLNEVQGNTCKLPLIVVEPL